MLNKIVTIVGALDALRDEYAARPASDIYMAVPRPKIFTTLWNSNWLHALAISRLSCTPGAAAMNRLPPTCGCLSVSNVQP